MPSAAVHWFRRDLRLRDNTAFHRACAEHDLVIPVFLLPTRDDPFSSPNRRAFLLSGLRSLDEDLRSRGSRLVLRQGPPLEELLRLCRGTGCRTIHLNRHPDPQGRLTEERLVAACRDEGISVHLHHDISVHPAEAVLTASGSAFKVFTAYHRAWLRLPLPQPLPVADVKPCPPSVQGLTLPSHSETPHLPEASEAAALRRLRAFLSSSVFRYHIDRDRPAVEGTSRLSQDLRFGLLSARTVYHAADELLHDSRLEGEAVRGVETFLRELVWREFYLHILHHHPEVLEQEFAPAYRGMRWSWDQESFRRWAEGRTGFPFVDAGMRQLAATGFMHNRLRMVTAMFLTKDLHIDWRMGERHFMNLLTDGEIASNNGGWQWSAGTGADAAPYFRILNPWTQGRRFDPDGAYIKRWIPELRDVPAERLHRPPETPLAAGYPLPMVDHATERRVCLDLFRGHGPYRRNPEGAPVKDMDTD